MKGRSMVSIVDAREFIDNLAAGKSRVFFNSKDYGEYRKWDKRFLAYSDVVRLKKGWQGETSKGSLVGTSRQVAQGTVIVAPTSHTADDLSGLASMSLPESIFGRPPVAERTFTYLNREYAVWWLTQEDVEFLTVRERDIRLIFGTKLSDDIWAQIQSLQGRNGRGRLWVSDSDQLPPGTKIELVTPKYKSILGDFLEQCCGGVVVPHNDATITVITQTLPGVMTDLNLERLYNDSTS